MDAILTKHEREKKKKYLSSCTEQRRHFTPFVVTTDGVLGREADHFIRHIAKKLSTKWERPYSIVCGYLRMRMSIAIARATHLCLRGSRIPTSRMSNYRQPIWEDGAGLGFIRN